MPSPQEARLLFSELVQRPDEEIDLVEAALLIAADQGSDVIIELRQTQIDNMARRVKDRMAEFSKGKPIDPMYFPIEVVQVTNLVLYAEEGFYANRDDYYDPENSYLDRVLERRTGIPITLGLVYMEIARRVGLPLRGIGLPGHFVLGYWPHEDRLPEMIIDPFDRGNILSIGECAGLVYKLYGPSVEFNIEWVRPMSNRQILARMLNNLKHAHTARRDYQNALGAIDLLLLAQPEATWELKERAFIQYRMGHFAQALKDLERYIQSNPDEVRNAQIGFYFTVLQRLAVSNN